MTNKCDHFKIFYFYSVRTYKAWYYGLYIQTSRNIIVDSCTVVDGNVGIFTMVIGPDRMFYLKKKED